jgi:hypothetical protein
MGRKISHRLIRVIRLFFFPKLPSLVCLDFSPVLENRPGGDLSGASERFDVRRKTVEAH